MARASEGPSQRKGAIFDRQVFKRIKSKTSYPDNPSNGTWDQLSSSYTLEDGKKESHTKETATRFHIITPTNWMRISHRNNKFENAMGCTYSMEGNKGYSLLGLASFPVTQGEKFEFIQRVKGNNYLKPFILQAFFCTNLHFNCKFVLVL